MAKSKTDQIAEYRSGDQIIGSALTAKDIQEQVNVIQKVMEQVMTNGVHYGTIPGTNKPTLYKAGSEKILSTFHIAVDPQIEDLSSEDEIKYRVVARGLYRGSDFVGAGVGVCSTNEEKYKWRAIVNKDEFDEAPETRRRIKHSKSGKIFQVRTNPDDLANTILKMAKKRAQIDLTLTATGASDIFSQDLEDIEVEKPINGKPIVAEPEPLNASKLPDFDQEIKKLAKEQRIGAAHMRKLLSSEFKRDISSLKDLTLVEKETTVKMLKELKNDK